MYPWPELIPTVGVRTIIVVLWSTIVWMILMWISVLWLAFFNMFETDWLGTGPMWSQYIFNPFRILDGVAIVTIMGWLVASLFRCRSKQGLLRRSMVVIGYSLYVLFTSPIIVSLINHYRTGCWSGSC